MKRTIAPGIVVLLAASLPLAVQADVAADVQQQCGGCHALSHDYASQDISERAQRKGPPLDYAGNKFQRDWLATWLEKPVRIRPAGIFPPARVSQGPNGDVVDPATLPAHPAVPAAQAAAIADYLMTLTPRNDLIEAETWQPGTIAERMGKMNFGKFKGCDGCHQDEPGVGGVSGPELYTAWRRLQPAFISSYIADPVAWDAHSMMPRGDSNSDAVHKLADYLKVIGEKQP